MYVNQRHKQIQLHGKENTNEETETMNLLEISL